MLITTNLSVSGPLSLSSVSSTTTSLSTMILESGLVKSRILGSMSLKGDNEYLPQIGLSFPNIFNLNTNILDFTNQSLTVSLANQTANTFLAAPNGLSGTPSFRAIIASDIPILNQNTTGNASTATALQTARTLTIGNTGKTFNGTSNVSWSLAEIGAQSILTNPITGTGTTNFLSKFTASGTIGNSNIFDNGTHIGIGTTTPGARLDVRAQGALSTNIAFRVRNSTDTRNFLVVNGAGDVYNNGAGGINTNTFFGENVGRNTTGINNTAIGLSALRSNTTGGFNTAIGVDALFSNTTGYHNTAIGISALLNNTTGYYNTAIGLSALRSNTTGGNNTAIGREAGNLISDGSNNTITDKSIFIGVDTRALADNQTNQIVIGNGAIGLGSNSVVLGNDSIVTTALKGNVGIGTTSPQAKLDVRAQGALSTDIVFRVRNSTDTRNFLVVNGAGDVYNNGAGGINTNTFFGENVGRNTTGINNTAIGLSALRSNTTGGFNTAIGISALRSNTTGGNNTAIAPSALESNTTGNNNTAIGLSALFSNTTGGDNTAIGLNALLKNTTGNYNTAIGEDALLNNTTGGNNTAIGLNALLKNTTGNNNTAIGLSALLNNTTGGNNTAIGISALSSNTTGYYNTAIGLSALLNNTTGGNNTAIGREAGNLISDGSNNTITNQSIFIGVDTRALANNQINQIVIGNGAIGLGSNSVVLGNDSIVTTALKGNVGIGTSNPLAKLHVVGTSALVSVSASIDVSNDSIIMSGKNSSVMYLEDGVASFGHNPGGDFRGVRANYNGGVWFENESGCKLGLQPVDNNLWSEGHIIQVAEEPSNKKEPVAWIKIFNNDDSSFYFMPVYQ